MARLWAVPNALAVGPFSSPVSFSSETPITGIRRRPANRDDDTRRGRRKKVVARKIAMPLPPKGAFFAVPFFLSR